MLVDGVMKVEVIAVILLHEQIEFINMQCLYERLSLKRQSSTLQLANNACKIFSLNFILTNIRHSLRQIKKRELNTFV